MIFKDEHDHVFGAFCCEKWHVSTKYYGRGESFVFTFENDEDIKVFHWAEEAEMYQYSDETSIMIGGGKR